MSSTLTNNQAETSGHRFHSLCIERVSGLLTNAVESAYNLMVFLIDWTVMLVPYLLYTQYQYDEEDETYSAERYSQMIKSHETLWNLLYDFSLKFLAILFPMVSNSGVPLCSSAGCAATIALIVGMTSGLATRVLSNPGAGAFNLHQERFISEWLKASQKPWRKVPNKNKSFWILLSLPLINFVFFFGLSISTIVLSVWERPIAGTAPSSEMQGCSVERRETFKYLISATFAVMAAQIIFIIVKLRSMMTLQSTGITAAV